MNQRRSKVFLVCVLVVFVSLLALQQTQAQINSSSRNLIKGYRGAKWGTSLEEVRRFFEDKEFDIQVEYGWRGDSADLFIADIILGERVRIDFRFVNDQFCEVFITPTEIKLFTFQVFAGREEGAAGDNWTYKFLKKLLTEKYGLPKEDWLGKVLWEDSKGNTVRLFDSMPIRIVYRWRKFDQLCLEKF